MNQISMPVERSVSEIREAVQAFVAQEMSREQAREWDAKESSPDRLVPRLAQLGLTGLTVPREYGGAGRNIPGALAVIEELSKRSLAAAVPYLMCACYAGVNILECGSEEQKREFLPKVQSGEVLFSFGLTEPDSGSDLAGISTVARREGGDVIVSGRKQFINGPNMANYIYTLVRSGPPDQRYRNMSLVLIPTGERGVRLERVQSIGMRGGAALCNVIFDEVRIPERNIVGGDQMWDKGWQMLVGPGLDIEKLEVAAMALGIAEAALEDAWSYAEQRVQFGRSISAFQSTRHLLVDVRTRIFACRLMLEHAAELAQRRQPCVVESSMAKLFICEEARSAVLQCQSVLGAYGCIAGSDMERYVRDSQILPLVGGSSAIQRNNIAKQLGLRQ
jgi:alkylation response protein AidB-like acyl-CoA dehydrogenase